MTLLDEAQENFRKNPTTETAVKYIDQLHDDYLDKTIGPFTFKDGMKEVMQWLKASPR